MCNKIRLAPLFCALLLCFSACSKTAKGEGVTVLAPASLEPALTQIITQFSTQSTAKIVASYGASGQLAAQIIAGASADIFISAGQKQMQAVKENKLCCQYTPLLKNKLVAVSYLSPPDLLSLDAFKTIAIGEPSAVPAGEYAVQVLKALNVYDKNAEKLVFAGNVREVLTMVKTKNADIGFVYKTDALAEKDLKMQEISQTLYDEIIYPYCLLTNGAKNKSAQEFLDFLLTDAAKEIFTSFGFESF